MARELRFILATALAREVALVSQPCALPDIAVKRAVQLPG